MKFQSGIIRFFAFQDVVNNHVGKLRSLVGKKSGTDQELPPKKLAVSKVFVIKNQTCPKLVTKEDKIGTHFLFT